MGDFDVEGAESDEVRDDVGVVVESKQGLDWLDATDELECIFLGLFVCADD